MDDIFTNPGMADPDFTAAANAVRSVGTAIGSGVNSLGNGCKNGLQWLMGSRKSD